LSQLARALIDDLASDPQALERLRALVSDQRPEIGTLMTPAFTVATLATELGRSERSIRAAIARGELQAVKRGRGWVIARDAVAAWARAPIPRSQPRPRSGRPRRRSGPGPATTALRELESLK
jgi:excisionase family DNA binding protein